jgi:hypothetical protein
LGLEISDIYCSECFSKLFEDRRVDLGQLLVLFALCFPVRTTIFLSSSFVNKISCICIDRISSQSKEVIGQYGIDGFELPFF